MDKHLRIAFPSRPAVLAALVLFSACEREAGMPGDEAIQQRTPTAGEERAAPGLPPPVTPAEPSADLLDGIKEFVEASGETVIPPFRHALTNLNEDGRHDAIVLLQGSDWCVPDGCTMLAFRGDDEGALLMSSSTAASEPIRISPEETGGWKDIIVHSKDMGDVVMRFDGTGYPSNASVQTQATPAQMSAARTLPLVQAGEPPAP